MNLPAIRRVSLGLLFALAAVAAGAPAADGDIARRVVVPRDKKPHGEVRLVQRDGQLVVQTLLHSKVIRRVAGVIAKKERGNWPAPDGSGIEDSQRYVDALARVAKAVRGEDAAGDDRRRTICIEFLLDGGAGRVTISAARVSEADDGLELLERTEPRVTLTTSGEYARRNRRLILADAFGIDEQQAEALLDGSGD